MATNGIEFILFVNLADGNSDILFENMSLHSADALFTQFRYLGSTWVRVECPNRM